MSIVGGYNPRLNYPAVQNITININKGHEENKDDDKAHDDCGCDESGKGKGKGKGKGLLQTLFGKGKGKAKDKNCGCRSGCDCQTNPQDAGQCGTQTAQGPQQMMAEMLGMMSSMMQQMQDMGLAGGGGSCYGVGNQMGGFRHPGFGI